MTKEDKAAAVTAVFEGTESAVKYYGWDTNDSKEQAIRETASEFGVTFEEIAALLP